MCTKLTVFCVLKRNRRIWNACFAPIKKISLALLGGCLILSSGGCVTTEPAADTPRAREDFLLLEEKLMRTQGKVESLEMEYQRLAEEARANRAANDTSDRQRALQARLEALEGRLAALEAARERDRQQIVEQLSTRMAEIMRAGAPASARGSSAAVPQGWAEHEVQAGETLSSIAAAYKVSAQAIIEANQLKDPNHLRKGQKLVIPK